MGTSGRGENERRLLVASGDDGRALYLIVERNGCCLTVVTTEGRTLRAVPCRLATLRDAADGMTVHLAGRSDLCSITLLQGQATIEISSAKGEPTIRFAVLQGRLRELVSQISSAEG